jgi:hypothetical protein
MEVKLFEVRDRATFIPCFGILMAPEENIAYGPEIPEDILQAEEYLLRRGGFSFENPLVTFGRLDGGSSQYDPYSWGGSRTMTVAHAYITEHWAELRSGSVVDVEFIRGETLSQKLSERVTRFA